MYPYERLLIRLEKLDRELAVLVGAPISMTYGDPCQGVPDVQGVLELVRERALKRGQLEMLEGDMAGVEGAAAYQAAFSYLDSVGGLHLVNEVVRQAVLQARLPDAADNFEKDGRPEGWHIPRGTCALGRLVSRYPRSIVGPILTTNFDPLLSASIVREGGQHHRQVLTRDGSLGNRAERVEGVRLVHLHGYWRDSETMHLPHHLSAERRALTGALRELLCRKTVLVAAYGGWDDVFMTALRAVLATEDAEVDVIWTFYGDRARAKEEHHQFLTEFGAHPRVTCYYGVDVHQLFEDMLAQAEARDHDVPNAAAEGESTMSDVGLGSADSPTLELAETPVEIIAQCARVNPNLRHELTTRLSHSGTERELAERFVQHDNLWMLTWMCNALLESLRASRDEARLGRADAIMAFYYRRAVVLARRGVVELDDDGRLVLPSTTTNGAEPTVAAESGRITLEYWPVGERDGKLEARYGVEFEWDWRHEPGMTVDQRVADTQAQLLDSDRERVLNRALQRTEAKLELPFDSTRSLRQRITDLASELRVRSGTGEEAPSHYFTVIRGADNPLVAAFGDHLRSQIPRLRVIYCRAHDGDQREADFVNVLTTLLTTYQAIQDDCP